MEEVGVCRSSWKNWFRGSTDGSFEIRGYDLEEGAISAGWPEDVGFEVKGAWSPARRRIGTEKYGQGKVKDFEIIGYGLRQGGGLKGRR